MSSSQLNIELLSTAEKIILAEELWESARKDADNIPISDAVRTELERRHALCEAGKMEYFSWEEVKANLMTKLPPKG